MNHSKLKEISFLCLFFTLLGILYTYPLVNYFNTGIPFTRYEGEQVIPLIQGDHLELYYNSWLLKDNVLSNRNPFSNPYPFNYGEEKRFHPQITLLSFLFLILSPLGNIFAYNSLVILSFTLAGLSAYLLVKLYTRQPIAALMGSLIFALAPYRLAQLGGHTTGFLFFLLPLAIYFLEVALAKGSTRYGILGGLSILALAWSEYHLFYYFMLFLAAYLPFKVLLSIQKIFYFNFSLGLKKIRRILFCRRLLPYHLIPLAAGTASGVSLLMASLYSNSVAYQTAVILIPLLSFSYWLLWMLTSAFMASLVKIKASKILQKDALTYLPFSILLLYIFKYYYPLPRLADILLITVLFLVFFQKSLFLVRHRAFLIPSQEVRIQVRAYGKALVPFFILILLSTAYIFLVKAIIFEPSIAKGGRGFQEIALFSPSLKDIFIRFNARSERFIYLGLIPIVLIVYLLTRIIRSSKRRPFPEGSGERLTVFFYFSVLITSYVLTFGPNLKAIPLYPLFFKVVPYFNFSRVTARIIILSFLSLSVLAGLAVKGLFQSLEHRKKTARVIVSFLAVAILIDYFPARTMGICLLDKGNPVYETIQKNIKKEELVLEIPLWPGDSSWSSLYGYYVTLYRYKMVNGYSPVVPRKYIEQVFNPLYPLDFGQISHKEYEILKKLKVRYLVMHENEEAFPDKVSPFPPSFTTDNLMNSSYLKFIEGSDNLYLFEVLDKPLKEGKGISPSCAVATIYEAEKLPRRTGRLVYDPKASGYYFVFLERKNPQAPLIPDPGAPRGNVVAASREMDPAGLLSFGPYRTYPAGEYLARFRLKAGDVQMRDPLVRIEVTADGGSTVLASREIRGIDFKEKEKFEDFPLYFDQDQLRKLEFRTFFHKRADLWLDSIIVSFADQDHHSLVFEAEELWRRTGTPVDDFEASHHRAVLAKAAKDKPSFIISGPYRTYPPGRYLASFRIKAGSDRLGEAAALDNRRIATIDVVSDFGRMILARREIRVRDIKEMNRYQEISMAFDLDLTRELEFRVLFEKAVDVWVDKVDIHPR